MLEQFQENLFKAVKWGGEYAIFLYFSYKKIKSESFFVSTDQSVLGVSIIAMKYSKRSMLLAMKCQFSWAHSKALWK